MEKEMKEWTREEFLNECKELCWNPYTYDYSRMPHGYCNGHKVGPFEVMWHSIYIDGRVCDMALYSEKYPNGFADYHVDGKKMTALEYVEYQLRR